ncbi:MAG: phosphomannomutase/phosphoglucomutase [Chloroflexi bacterium]|nr:phosphomannomutase/phosphoglucomutase [Chloroflexota bacterium]MCY3696395.1 phosphomannomutase/phosphoglucomutase [Chloroflexota bacterium]
MPDPTLPSEIVRAYDIRGTTPDQIDGEVARRVGNGFAQWLLDRGATALIVGHDTRDSSPELYEAAIEGALRAGIDVHAAGLAPTPVIGWAVDRECLGGGLVVTASHNPPEYNGFKLLADGAQPLLPEEIVHVARHGPAAAADLGTRREIDAVDPYMQMLHQRFRDGGAHAVAIDPGNGTTALTAAQALIAAGAQVHTIRSTPRPTRHVAADPQNPETMRELARMVRAMNADLGIAWDGDGDRIGVLDHLGRRYEADWLTAVLARPLLARRPGSEVLLDMKTSSSAIDDIRRRGGHPLTAKTGYSFFRRMMREQQIAFGGETSGHIMFGPEYRAGEDAPWIDDGVYAACALVAYLTSSGRTLAEEMSEIEPRPISPELRLPCPDHDKAHMANALGDWFAERYPRAEIDRSDGARVRLPDGWLHARASNTAPALSLRFESHSESGYRRLAEQLEQALSCHPQVDGVEQLRRPPTIGPQSLI